MKRIAHITQCYLPVVGGQEVYIEHLNEILNSAGYETHAYQPNRQVSHPSVTQLPRIRGIGKIIPNWERFSFACLVRVLQSRALDNEDLIISHYATSASMLPKKLLDKTIILSHGIEWRVDRMNADDRLHEWNARRLFNQATIIANDTDYLRRFGVDVEPGKNCFTEVAPGKWFIPNCVDISRFTKTEGVVLDDRKVILVPRQIHERRGIDLAINAFKLVCQETSEYSMHIVGAIRGKKYFSMCKDLVSRHGLDDVVTFHTEVPNSEMPKYYSSASMTLIPTRGVEGTSLSALESMSCGTPAVCTNVGGLPDLPSVIVSPTPRSIADGILSTSDDLEQIAARQQQKVHTVYNSDNWGKAWLDVISKVTS